MIKYVATPADNQRILDLYSLAPSAISSRAYTDILFVSADGSNKDGSSWAKAFQNPADAFDECSTDVNAMTLIMIAPKTGNIHYDINRTGTPTWAANVVLKGSHRNYAKIMNDHASAAAVMKFTGRAVIEDVNINLGTGNHGVIMTAGGGRARHCQFVGEDLESAKTGLWLDHASGAKHFKIEDVDSIGHVSYMTALKVDQFSHSAFEKMRIHECLVGVHVVGAAADHNLFSYCDIGECAKGILVTSGNEQFFHEVVLHHNTVNVDDASSRDHIWANIHGAFPMTIHPDDMTGVTLTAGADANLWGADTELRSAAAATKPFRVIASYVEPTVAQWYQLRLSADSGSTFFDRVMTKTARAAGSLAPAGTEFIFNAGTRISGSLKAESGGNDTLKLWLKIQEI